MAWVSLWLPLLLQLIAPVAVIVGLARTRLAGPWIFAACAAFVDSPGSRS